METLIIEGIIAVALPLVINIAFKDLIISVSVKYVDNSDR